MDGHCFAGWPRRLPPLGEAKDKKWREVKDKDMPLSAANPTALGRAEKLTRDMSRACKL